MKKLIYLIPLLLLGGCSFELTPYDSYTYRDEYYWYRGIPHYNPPIYYYRPIYPQGFYHYNNPHPYTPRPNPQHYGPRPNGPGNNSPRPGRH